MFSVMCFGLLVLMLVIPMSQSRAIKKAVRANAEALRRAKASPTWALYRDQFIDRVLRETGAGEKHRGYVGVIIMGVVGRD